MNTAELQMLKAHAQNTLDAMPKAIDANDKMRLVLEVERLQNLLAGAVERIKDMLEEDDGQAWKEARKFLERNSL